MQEAGEHVTCRLADSNLERICRLFSYLEQLRVEARGDGSFF